MAFEETPPTPVVAAEVSTPATQVASVHVAAAAAPEKLDELEEINFLLEEIESKIAPLALA
ncbi:Xan family putative trans-acting RiPP leader peptide [Archangium violaceum]|uniref:Xan family putative trans-acting RiPP leader peptide n=1 Tax=Archangium violaceum TaxID=83451 RepID=UPI001950D457|nr:Xan family putative trans-acting RiPP leader peptide [Archangium violaceum]QRN95008.1 Xan family putative trans-acting RiPP leader peptide [Archangium violaceum]